ncbi:MAG: UDP-3-O-acyl-N-acetylglucosamine deacetylase [Acidobacteriota bacterium]|nr:UDP-3-O-acyl-N-acetylglucosamine deacetylase [Acidobacteriota bacterium]
MPSHKTLRRPAEVSGLGVHSGKTVTLRILPSETGRLVFRRPDLGGAEMGLALARVESRNSTALIGERFAVRTIEHVLAAFYAFGVTSAVLAVDADEMPIMDGSALPFVRAIEAAGIADLNRPISGMRIMKPLTVEDKGAWVRLEPIGGDGPAVLDYTIVYDHPAIGTSRLQKSLTPEVFEAEIAPARTFGFLKDVEMLHAQGLALGASLDNTIALDDHGVVNPPLRFPDEYVRHKLLDLAGDLALLGRPLIGRASAYRAGHRLHLEAVKKLLSNPDGWISY